MKKRILLTAALALVALTMVSMACGDGENGDAESVTDDEHQEIVVVASDTFSFDPSEITVQAGEPVHLVLDNSAGALLHDIVIEGLKATDVSTEGGSEHMHESATEMPMDDHMDEAATDDHMDEAMDDHMDEEAMDDHDSDLHVAAEAGETAILEFTPTESGTFAFYCSVEGHRDSGMEGTLTVE